VERLEELLPLSLQILRFKMMAVYRKAERRGERGSISVDDLQLPDLVPRDPLTFEMLRTLHHTLAWTLIAVLAVHLLAVIHHDILRRDGIFRRMRPFSS